MPSQFEGFVYVNIENPMAAWNVVRSSFYSPSELPSSERPNAMSFGMADLLRNGNARRAVAEFSLEDIRRQNFPNAVSRLTGTFVFDDVASAAKVWESDDWSGHFEPKYLTDVGVWARNSSRHDAVWITMMRDTENKLIEGWEEMAASYWSGKPASDQPIWECIIEGSVIIWGLSLKTKALAEIKEYWPQSLLLLEIAANSAAIGSLDGAILPFANRRDENLFVGYYLRMMDTKEPEFCEQLADFVSAGGDSVCRLGSGGGSLVTPDFSCYSFERRIENMGLIW